jgi:uncharacterized protein YhbP (UPF0306 family)
MDDISEFLAVSTMVLATTDGEGRPYAAPLYFAADEKQQLYFFSSPRSQHSQHLAHRPQAAVSFYPESASWQEIRGVQMRGEVVLVAPGPWWESVWIIYRTKFPFVETMQDEIARNQLYAFKPMWIRLVDNRQGFGYKREWTLP